MRALLKDRKEIAQDTLYLAFDLLGQELTFQAGQFFTLTLSNPSHTDNRGNQRFLGFINSPSKKGIVETATVMGVSAFKKSLVELELGSEVEIGPVGGEGVLKDKTKPLVYVASGIGIVPFMSAIHMVKDLNLPDKIILLYEQTDKASTAFFDELTTYAKENQNFTCIITLTDDSSWVGEKRKIDSQFFKEYLLKPEIYHYVITGPLKNVLAIQNALKVAGAKPEDIRIEIFSGY